MAGPGNRPEERLAATRRHLFGGGRTERGPAGRAGKHCWLVELHPTHSGIAETHRFIWL